jgi:hypothetical protein
MNKYRRKELTNWLTPQNWILFEKLPIVQLRVLKNFPTFHGRLKFIALSTGLYPNPDESSLCPHSICLKYILGLYSHLYLGLRSGSFLLNFRTKFLHVILLSECVLHALDISSLDHSNYIWQKEQGINLLIMQFFNQPHAILSLLDQNTLFSTLD